MHFWSLMLFVLIQRFSVLNWLCLLSKMYCSVLWLVSSFFLWRYCSMSNMNFKSERILFQQISNYSWSNELCNLLETFWQLSGSITKLVLTFSSFWCQHEILRQSHNELELCPYLIEKKCINKVIPTCLKEAEMTERRKIELCL